MEPVPLVATYTTPAPEVAVESLRRILDENAGADPASASGKSIRGELAGGQFASASPDVFTSGTQRHRRAAADADRTKAAGRCLQGRRLDALQLGTLLGGTAASASAVTAEDNSGLRSPLRIEPAG